MKFKEWLSTEQIIEAMEISHLIIEGNYGIAKENFDNLIKGLDSMQTIALRDAIKYFSND